MTKNAKIWGLGTLAASAAAAGFLLVVGVRPSEPPKTDVECLSDLIRNTEGLNMAATRTGQGLMEFTATPEMKQHVANYADCLQRYADSKSGWSFELGRN